MGAVGLRDRNGWGLDRIAGAGMEQGRHLRKCETPTVAGRQEARPTPVAVSGVFAVSGRPHTECGLRSRPIRCTSCSRC